MHHSNTRRGYKNTFFVAVESCSILYSSKIIFVQIDWFIGYNRVMVEYSEIMELNIMIIEVVLNFCLLSTIIADNRSFQSQVKSGRRCTSCQLSTCHLKKILSVYSSVHIVFAVSYTEPVKNTRTITRQSLCSQIEKCLFCAILFDRKMVKLSTDPSKISGIDKLCYNALVTFSVIIRFLCNIFSYDFLYA